MHGRAEAIPGELHFDVARRAQKAFQENGAGPKRSQRLRGGDRENLAKRVFVFHDAHPFPAAAGSRLQHQGVANHPSHLDAFVEGVHRPVTARKEGEPSCTCCGLGGKLVAELLEVFGRGADERHAVGVDCLGKCGVFCQKSVSRVYRI